jgi:hypothetical protein
MRLSASRLTAVLVPLLAAACTTQMRSPMTYTPTVAVNAATGQPTVGVLGRIANERRTGREDPTWIGTIRGGYGNPLQALHADEPVDRVVARAFADGLRARGLYATADAQLRYALAITIHEFDANQYVRREAAVDFSVALTERATGREVWRDCHRAYDVDGSILALGEVFAVEDLRRVALGPMKRDGGRAARQARAARHAPAPTANRGAPPFSTTWALLAQMV